MAQNIADLIAALTPQREVMPWERGSSTPVFDMFGSQDENPALRRARELEHDRALASEVFKARIAQPRAWETPEAIASEVFAPLTAEFGPEIAFSQRGRMPASGATTPKLPSLVKSGSTILKQNPFTGELEVAYQPPDNTNEKISNEISKASRSKVNRDFGMYQNALLKLDRESPTYDDDRRDILRNLVRLDNEWRTLTASPFDAPEPTAVPESTTTGRGFIGRVGGDNHFENPFERGLKMGGGTSSPSKVRRYRYNPVTGDFSQ